MWRLLTQTWTQRSSSVLVASVLLFYLAWFHLISGRFTVTGNRRVRDAHSEQSVFPSDDEIVRAALQYSHTDQLTTEVLQRYLLRYNYPVLLTVYMYTFVMNTSQLILQLRSEQDVQLQSKASIRKPLRWRLRVVSGPSLHSHTERLPRLVIRVEKESNSIQV